MLIGQNKHRIVLFVLSKVFHLIQKNVQEKKFKVRHLCTNFDKNKIVEQYQFTPTTIGMSEKDFKK